MSEEFAINNPSETKPSRTKRTVRAFFKAKKRPVMRDENTIIRGMVRFMQRPSGVTHAEIVKKFGFRNDPIGRADERSRFWRIINDYGFDVRKTKLPPGSKREGRKLFTLAKGATPLK